MRVAIIQYWLVTMRGGEKVLEALLDLFPQADIFTHAYAPEAISPRIRQQQISTSFIQKLPYATKLYQYYLPLMPLALEQLDLRDYDLIISCESGPAKGVLVPSSSLHLCYCHTPMRYLWDFYQDYLENSGWATRLFLRVFSHYLRLWDLASAQRVDFFAANSHNVARRIAKHYRRPSTVIPPPVDVDIFAPEDGNYPSPDDYYLYVGQLIPYKRPDLAVQACTRLDKHLIVVGEGAMRKELTRMAGPTVSFRGHLQSSELKRYLARCRALLFPGEEDFGIVPLEALAAGRPVIAYGRGGALETITEGLGGLLFHRQDVPSLCRAMVEFESGTHSFQPARLNAEARRFSPEIFRESFKAFYNDSVKKGPRKDLTLL